MTLVKSDLHPLFDSDVRGIVFDLDGTLVDSAADIIAAMRLTFADAGFGMLPRDYFPENLHGTTEGIMRSVAADMGWVIPEDLDALRRSYVAHQLSMSERTIGLYDDVLPVLQACREAGLKLAICTNKSHAGALAATAHVGIRDYFDYITGADSWAQAKPSPVPLWETIRELGLAPQQCLYFGDTSVDAQCAQAADVRFVLYESGYGDPEVQNYPRHFAFRQWKDLSAGCENLALEDEIN